MKYLFIILLAVILVGCDSDPVSVVAPAPNLVQCVFKYRHDVGHNIYIYADGAIVSFLKLDYEADTVMVEDGAYLRAKIYTGQVITYADTAAYDGLYWELP